jgi:hypothetical protein
MSKLSFHTLGGGYLGNDGYQTQQRDDTEPPLYLPCVNVNTKEEDDNDPDKFIRNYLDDEDEGPLYPSGVNIQ